MKINYANNPLLGPGKWDALLSLLTPEGDSITVPAEIFNPIRVRAGVFTSKGIAFFSSSKKGGVHRFWRTSQPVWTDGYKIDLTKNLEKMKVGAVMDVPDLQREPLRNSTHNLKKKGIGEYRTYREAGKLFVVRIK